ncbi:NAD(P)/FAD-dependent oxidoreductase [Verrucomicrobium spinosum]|uniref:NAD(P)/FAD-dependent oxidoreductase n=1 Tax=Verrucomicrobium spinosum TaxID=2736 RepID=UPI00094680D7|nr:FAD-dependent monooxygenase [Verrucomicrobium spinosum]
MYEELGVWEKISQAGFMRKKGAQFLLGDGTRKVRLDFSKGSFTEFPEAVQVERAKFDNILLTHSQECGAEVRQESLVQDLQVDADGVAVKYRDKEGASHQVKAKFLIDASGLSNFTANRENRRTYYAEHKKIAIFNHFAGVDMPQGEEYGDILVIRRNNSWFWMIPLEDDKVSVGLVMDRGDFQALGQEPDRCSRRPYAPPPPCRSVSPRWHRPPPCMWPPTSPTGTTHWSLIA